MTWFEGRIGPPGYRETSQWAGVRKGRYDRSRSSSLLFYDQLPRIN